MFLLKVPLWSVRWTFSKTLPLPCVDQVLLISDPGTENVHTCLPIDKTVESNPHGPHVQSLQGSESNVVKSHITVNSAKLCYQEHSAKNYCHYSDLNQCRLPGEIHGTFSACFLGMPAIRCLQGCMCMTTTIHQACSLSLTKALMAWCTTGTEQVSNVKYFTDDLKLKNHKCWWIVDPELSLNKSKSGRKRE